MDHIVLFAIGCENEMDFYIKQALELQRAGFLVTVVGSMPKERNDSISSLHSYYALPVDPMVQRETRNFHSMNSNLLVVYLWKRK